MPTEGFLRACPHTVNVYRKEGAPAGPYNRHGQAAYPVTATSSRRARVVQKQRLVRSFDGSEVPSSTTIVFAEDFALDPDDRLQLVGFTPEIRPLLGVGRFPDSSGSHHVEAYL
jgi:hypothetical protein